MKKNRNKFKRDYFKTAVRTRTTRVINHAYRIWEAIMSSNLKGIKSAELKYMRSLSWKNLLRNN